MNLYLVRHGKTEYNKKRLYQGRTDIPLSLDGRAECFRLSKELRGVEFDVVYSSPLIRALETAEIVAPSSKVIVDNRIIERDLGDYEGTSFANENGNIDERFDDLNLNYSEKNVEGIKSLFDRVTNFIEEIKEKHKDKNVLIVTHNGAINVINHYINGLPKDGRLKYKKMGNTNYVKYEL